MRLYGFLYPFRLDHPFEAAFVEGGPRRAISFSYEIIFGMLKALNPALMQRGWHEGGRDLTCPRKEESTVTCPAS